MFARVSACLSKHATHQNAVRVMHTTVGIGLADYLYHVAQELTPPDQSKNSNTTETPDSNKLPLFIATRNNPRD